MIPKLVGEAVDQMLTRAKLSSKKDYLPSLGVVASLRCGSHRAVLLEPQHNKMTYSVVRDLRRDALEKSRHYHSVI